jgi:uncharacterized metal-binding protein
MLLIAPLLGVIGAVVIFWGLSLFLLFFPFVSAQWLMNNEWLVLFLGWCASTWVIAVAFMPTAKSDKDKK